VGAQGQLQLVKQWGDVSISLKTTDTQNGIMDAHMKRRSGSETADKGTLIGDRSVNPKKPLCVLAI